MFRFNDVLINYIKLIFKFFIQFAMITSFIVLLVNFYFFVMYINPLISSKHILLTSDYQEIFIVIFSTIIWSVVFIYKRSNLTKRVLSLFGPISLAIVSSKFIYMFHTTRSLFSDSMFFKFFGFAFFHKYNKTELLLYALNYLKNHNALQDVYFQLLILLDTTTISSIEELNQLLDKLLLSKEAVLPSLDNLSNNFNNVLQNCFSFIQSHSSLVFYTSIIYLFFLICFGLWYSGYFSSTSGVTYTLEEIKSLIEQSSVPTPTPPSASVADVNATVAAASVLVPPDESLQNLL